MTHLLRGRFDCKVDAKARVSLPSALRMQLSPKCSRLVLTTGLFKKRKCLDVFPEEEWKKLEKRIAALPALRPEVQAYQRFYLSSGQPVEIDNNGRLLIPPSLRKFAELTDELVVIGMGNKMEIWSSNVWSDLHKELEDQFEDIQAAVAGLME
ncbi:MAG: division/cell wall cluster transcriptional repressor MraZ, partial [Bdellovibrionales bacterium]|nr:division/cell wall cluster transcriptional repressor MraZ [Bdellovibrionales bacterium]